MNETFDEKLNRLIKNIYDAQLAETMCSEAMLAIAAQKKHADEAWKQANAHLVSVNAELANFVREKAIAYAKETI